MLRLLPTMFTGGFVKDPAVELLGAREVVVDGESGLLVPPTDVAALRSALDRLADDEALRSRLGDGARTRAEQFTQDAILPRFERAYERAIQHRRTRSGTA